MARPPFKNPEYLEPAKATSREMWEVRRSILGNLLRRIEEESSGPKLDARPGSRRPQ